MAPLREAPLWTHHPSQARWSCRTCERPLPPPGPETVLAACPCGLASRYRWSLQDANARLAQVQVVAQDRALLRGGPALRRREWWTPTDSRFLKLLEAVEGPPGSPLPLLGLYPREAAEAHGERVGGEALPVALEEDSLELLDELVVEEALPLFPRMTSALGEAEWAPLTRFVTRWGVPGRVALWAHPGLLEFL